jgi:hypothetical protein
MTLLDLVKHLRMSILDDTGGYSVDWETLFEGDNQALQLRWSNEELARFINEAQVQAVRRSLFLKETFSVNLAIPFSNPISLDPRVIKVESVHLASTGLNIPRRDYRDMTGISKWETRQGSVDSFCDNYLPGKIFFYRAPEVADSVTILASVLPLTALTWDTPSASPVLRPEHHLALCSYAAHLCYTKDEPNSADPAKAMFWLQKFTEEFSDTSAYAESRRRMRDKRGIRYGGL